MLQRISIHGSNLSDELLFWSSNTTDSVDRLGRMTRYTIKFFLCLAFKIIIETP